MAQLSQPNKEGMGAVSGCHSPHRAAVFAAHRAAVVFLLFSNVCAFSCIFCFFKEPSKSIKTASVLADVVVFLKDFRFFEQSFRLKVINSLEI